MLDGARGYARADRRRRITRDPRRGRARVLTLLVFCALLLASLAEARERAHVQVRLPAELPAEASQRLLSALSAQLADLASVELGVSDTARPLCMVWIASTPAGLSVQFAAAPGEALSTPRVIAGAPGELVASQIASISRAFVLARLAESEASAPSPPTYAANIVAAKPEAERPAEPKSAPPGPIAADAASKAKPAASASSAARAAEVPAPTPGAQVAETSAPTTTVAARPATREQSSDRPVWRESAPGRLRVAAFYTGTSYARALPWQNGLRAEASARLGAFIYLGVSYAYYAPAEVATTAVRLRVSAHALSAFFGLGRTWRVFGVGVDAALGCLDRLRRTTAVAGELMPDGASQRWSLLVGLRLHGRVRFPAVPWLALDLAPALELNPAAGRLAVLESAGKSDVLSPRFARARVDLGASFDVF